MNRKPVLPVDAILPEITATLAHRNAFVVEAPPGAGKTTRVPPALLEIVKGEVVVLEPRRIAARLAARRVAFEMKEPVGETVGYQVRFEEKVSSRTRLKFMTEGVLTRRIISDPALKGVAAVVLDEFHERHLETDLALALLKRLQKARPDLLIVVMSATLDTAPIARYLGNCPIIRSEGKLFPLSIDYLPYSPLPLEAQVRAALEGLIREGYSGDILTFLPGAAEIRRAMRECEAVARRADMLVLPLHGSLSPDEQETAISPTNKQKLILSTNVAESSVTVEGVNAVIDSGLARFASYSSWTGLPTLSVGRISRASAKQRAGRAGRTGPGRVLRLYTQQDYQQRPEQQQPEILRSELSQLCLELRAMRIGIHDLDWLDAPPEAALESAESLLDRLGATGDAAKQLARYPLPPRLSRIVVESLTRGVGEDGCILAALLGSGVRIEKNDLLAAVEATHDLRLRQHIEQLRKIAHPRKQARREDDALLISVLTGFPDRVARRRKANEALLSSGASAEVTGDAPRYEFFVAVDAEDRSDNRLPLIRTTARVEPDWLIDLFPDHVHERNEITWNRTAERVDAVSALMYDQLVIQESRGAAPDPAVASEMLAQRAIEVGVDRFVDIDALNEFFARMEFAGITPPNVANAIRQLCAGLRSFAELKRAAVDMIPMLERSLGARQLGTLAPARIALQGGRQVKVHYENGKTPWIASRLQDFFGMRDTPRIGPDRVPVVVHLLAPNQRAVQTTTDLAGFWERLYPQVRKELMRRYPKHKWPERP